MYEELIDHVADNRWRAATQVLVIGVVAWLCLRPFRTTTGFRVFTGSLLVFILLLALTAAFDLLIFGWFVKIVGFFLFITLIVTFQPELRRIVSEIGSRGFLFFGENRSKELIDLLEESIRQLSSKRFGALIAIEQSIDLRSHLETGVRVDARFSKELILTIFHPRTAMHDGGMILRDTTIRGAACVFPVSQRELLDRSIGLRHRAGIGITEESDAIAIIVSEETGDISLCHNGRLERDLEIDEFRQRLGELLRGTEIHTPEDSEDEDSPTTTTTKKKNRKKTTGSGTKRTEGGSESSSGSP